MKLFYSPNSPYARKCRVIILEKKLEGIEQVVVNAMENPPELLAINPLGTVPAFITNDGLHLCDSSVICEYLDTLPSSAPRMISTDDGARVCVMALAVMAEGILNAAVACVLEARRPKENQYPAWVGRKEKAIARAIDKIAAANLDFSRPLSLGTINTAIALQYIDFRIPHLGWRTKHNALATWVDDMAKRPSFIATAPRP